MSTVRLHPGTVRDAIFEFLRSQRAAASVAQICSGVSERLGQPVPSSSVRSYLNLNVPALFVRTSHGCYQLLDATTPATQKVLFPAEPPQPAFQYRKSTVYRGECCAWLAAREERSIHAVITDPPYGLVEYTPEQLHKLRKRRGGVWRIPPSFDGSQRSPLPRFTTLTSTDIRQLRQFFLQWGRALRRVLVPGAHVFVASNPLISYLVASSLVEAGLERRGEVIRLVMTLRGGDRPKNAHQEFHDITVMPRSMWEPWLLFREPLEGASRTTFENGVPGHCVVLHRNGHSAM